MRILVGMMHPKHVYMFKNFIRVMVQRGHEVRIVTVEKDLTETLLKRANLPYDHIGENPTSFLGKLFNTPLWIFRTYNISRRFKPDIFVGQAFPHFAHVAALQGKPYIIFEDSEPAHVVQAITFPFASSIVTPSCYREDLGKKHVKSESYFELAYLHPNHFSPSKSVLKNLGLQDGEKYVVVRFVSWSAVHDIGQEGGFNIEKKRELIQEIAKYCKVIVSSESPLPKDLEKYRITLAPDKIHDLVYYATLVIGDSQTMTTEAGVLGTPAIRCNSFVGKDDMGNFLELENSYGLIFNYRSADEAIGKAIELLQDNTIVETWLAKRKRLLKEKCDFSQYMVEYVEGYL
mgnify:CR=1 FL=1